MKISTYFLNNIESNAGNPCLFNSAFKDCILAVLFLKNLILKAGFLGFILLHK